MSHSETTTLGGGGPLEQFVLLAKSARGAAAKGLVEQAVASPGVYVFGELLACPSIAELANSPGTKAHHDLLTLFAFGTYDDFVAQRAHLPPLNDAMLLKLRQLTIVSLATKNRRIPYSTLLNVLRLNNVRELEDIVIDAVYKGIIQGKLDPRNQRLEIELWRGRDVSQQETAMMLATLGDWASRSVLTIRLYFNANRKKRIAVAVKLYFFKYIGIIIVCLLYIYSS